MIGGLSVLAPSAHNSAASRKTGAATKPTLSGMGEDFSLDDLQATGLDAHSAVVELDLAIDRIPVSMVNREEILSVGYLSRSYTEDEIPVLSRLRCKGDSL